MHIAILSGGDGWHVRDLQRAAAALGHEADAVDFRRVQASASRISARRWMRSTPSSCAPCRRDRWSRSSFAWTCCTGWRRQGRRVLNPPRALETCVDKYLASARLEAAGLPVPPTIVCQDADVGAGGVRPLGGDVVVKPLFGSEGRGMVRVSDPETGLADLSHPGTLANRALPAAIHPSSRLGPARLRDRRPRPGGDAALRPQRLAHQHSKFITRR